MINIAKGDIDAVKNYPDFWLPVEVVAKFMGRNPQSLREQARVDPNRLGFPVSVIGVNPKRRHGRGGSPVKPHNPSTTKYKQGR